MKLTSREISQMDYSTLINAYQTSIKTKEETTYLTKPEEIF
jgi:hypothetical protein